MRWLVLTTALLLALAAAWVLLGTPTGTVRRTASHEASTPRGASDHIGSDSREALREILRAAEGDAPESGSGGGQR